MRQYQHYAVALVVFVGANVVVYNVLIGKMLETGTCPQQSLNSLSMLYTRTLPGEVHQTSQADIAFVDDAKQKSRITEFLSRQQPCQFCGVVTTIFDPTTATNQFLRLFPEACLVVVGDKKTDDSPWRSAEQEYSGRLIYLSAKDQETLPFESIRLLPWNHFGRKNIGYIYAMSQGAEWIYDFDDDNRLHEPVPATLSQVLKQSPQVDMRMVNREHHLFNPYPFYQPVDKDDNPAFTWPRGFPLSFIRDNVTFSMKRRVDEMLHASKGRVAVFQSLADHDPDVDAIYRMTRPLPLKFVRKDTILVVPPSTYSPWNAQAVLFRREGFWGMLLPVTVTGRVSDIWRSYITTRLLWDTGYHVAFMPACVIQYRNPHSYMDDYHAELDLYMKTDLMIATLANWTSALDETLPIAYVRLMNSLASAKLISGLDAKLAEAWVRDLSMLGYNWPQIESAHRQEAFTPPDAPVVDGRNDGIEKRKSVSDATVLATSATATDKPLAESTPRSSALERVNLPQSILTRSLARLDECKKAPESKLMPLAFSFHSSNVPKLEHAQQQTHSSVCPTERIRIWNLNYGGVGSNAFFGGWQLDCSFEQGKVFVEPLNGTLMFANPRHCPSQRWDCYFKPVASASCIEAVKSLSPQDYTAAIGFPSENLQAHCAITPSAKDKRVGDAVRYLARPNEALLSKARQVAEKLGVRFPFVTVQLRTGNRYMADGRTFPSVNQYADMVALAVERMGVDSVFVTTDDHNALPDFIQRVNYVKPNTSVHYIPEEWFQTNNVPPGGLVEKFIRELYAKGTHFDYMEMLLCDMLIASQGVHLIYSCSTYGDVIRYLMRDKGDKCWSYWSIHQHHVGSEYEFTPSSML